MRARAENAPEGHRFKAAIGRCSTGQRLGCKGLRNCDQLRWVLLLQWATRQVGSSRSAVFGGGGATASSSIPCAPRPTVQQSSSPYCNMAPPTAAVAPPTDSATSWYLQGGNVYCAYPMIEQIAPGTLIRGVMSAHGCTSNGFCNPWVIDTYVGNSLKELSVATNVKWDVADKAVLEAYGVDLVFTTQRVTPFASTTRTRTSQQRGTRTGPMRWRRSSDGEVPSIQ